MSEIRSQQIPVRADGLQLDEQRRFQRIFWTAQRMSWLAYAVILIVALTGLTGRGGPLSVRTETVPTATVELPRIARRGATGAVTVDFTGNTTDHRLRLNQDFLDHFEIGTITPRPVAEVALSGGVLFLFAAAGPPRHRVSLHVRARRAGLATAEAVIDGTHLPFRTFVLP